MTFLSTASRQISLIQTGNQVADSLISLLILILFIIFLNVFIVPPLQAFITCIQAKKLKQNLDFFQVLSLRRQGFRPVLILDALDLAQKNDIDITYRYLEKIFIERKGDGLALKRLVEALINAGKLDIPISWSDLDRRHLSPYQAYHVIEAIKLSRELGINLTFDECAGDHCWADCVFYLEEARDEGIKLDYRQLVEKCQAGKNVDDVVSAFIYAKESGVSLDLDQAFLIEENTGRVWDIVEAAAEEKLTKLTDADISRIHADLPRERD